MKEGSLKYVREDGEEVIAQPGEPMFSTVTMCATHYWENGAWQPIFEAENQMEEQQQGPIEAESMEQLVQELANLSVEAKGTKAFYDRMHGNVDIQELTYENYVASFTRADHPGFGGQVMVNAEGLQVLLTDQRFVALLDPVCKHELLLLGHVGVLLGAYIFTDAYLMPELRFFSRKVDTPLFYHVPKRHQLPIADLSAQLEHKVAT